MSFPEFMAMLDGPGEAEHSLSADDYADLKRRAAESEERQRLRLATNNGAPV